MSSFKDLGLDANLVQAVADLGFETPTPVQELVIPVALTSNCDIVALAQTGTGKTAAFGLPILQKLDPSVKKVQALVLCPTRELCVQVAGEIEKYAAGKHACKITPVYGGASIDTQIRRIKDGTQVVVATPGRLVDLINRRAIQLDNIRQFVLDEADEMLNMGFKDELDAILAASIGSEHTTWLFSATMSNEVRAISKNYMTDPKELITGKRNETNVNIEHVYYVCRMDDRYATLKRIVDAQPDIFGLIFCRTKAETKEIAEQMTRDGYNADALHGDLSQADRDRVMNLFRDGTLQLLIATDVAARGIDVSNISHVINYGLPDDNEVYTHRSGRTGRAGKTGVSITITTQKFEDRVRQIERASKASFKKQTIPTGDEVCQKQLFHIIKGIHNTEVQDLEIEPFLPQIYEELQDLTREDLIKRFASVEFNRFLSYYKHARDLNIYPKSTTRGNDRFDRNAPPQYPRAIGTMPRLFINMGSMDGLNKKDFVGIITKNFNVPARAFGDIDMKKTHTYFDIEAGYVDILKKEIHSATYDGRPLRVNDATEKPRDGKKHFGEEEDWKKKKKKRY